MRNVQQQADYSRLTEVVLRPRFEHAGAHLRQGVLGLNSLAEEALVNWFRVRGISPLVLSERYGREFSIVDCSSVHGGVVSLDDEVVASAVPIGVRHFNVRVAVRDGAAERVPLRARVTAVLVRRPGRFEDPPDEVAGMLVDGLEEAGRTERAASGANGWHRSWRVPMESCQFAGRMRHSAHLRALVECAEAFAEDRGLSAGRLLDERGLVSVLPRVRIRLAADACAGEILHARYDVQRVVGERCFECRFAAHKERDGRLVPAAFGVVLQGFARAGDPTGEPVALDPDTVQVMMAERAIVTM